MIQVTQWNMKSNPNTGKDSKILYRRFIVKNKLKEVFWRNMAKWHGLGTLSMTTTSIKEL